MRPPKHPRPGRRVDDGWAIAGTLAVTETVSWGVLYYVFAVFLVPMRAELGWSAAAITGAFSVALLIAGLAAPLVGRWLDRHGPRALMTAGSILGTLLVAAWAAVDNLAALYLVWAGIGLAMSATLYEPAFATLTAWFARDRDRALLLVTVAAGFASTIFLPLAGWLEDRLGWPGALLLLAALLGLLTIPPHLLVLRRPPAALGILPKGTAAGLPDDPPADRTPPSTTPRQALRQSAFWWLTTAFSLEAFATVAVGVHLIPYLTERGDGAAFAATATGLIGAAQVAARLLVTGVGDRAPRTLLAAGILALEAVALAILLLWPGIAAVVAVLLLGAGRGAMTLLRATLVADFYGPVHYGAINGLLALCLTGARAAAPVTAGLAYGWLGGYPPVFWGLAGCAAAAALAMVATGHARRPAPSSPAADQASRVPASTRPPDHRPAR